MIQEIRAQDEDELEQDSAMDGSIASELSNLGSITREQKKPALTVGIREEMSIDIQLEDALKQPGGSHEEKKRLDELEQ